MKSSENIPNRKIKMEKILSYVKEHKIKMIDLCEEMRCSINHLSCVLHGKRKSSHAFRSLLFSTLLIMMYSKRAKINLLERYLSAYIKKLKELIEEEKNE